MANKPTTNMKMNTNEDNESRREALLLGGVGPHGTATGGGLAPGVASASPNPSEGASSMATSGVIGSAGTVVPKGMQRNQAPDGETNTESQHSRSKLTDKLLQSSRSARNPDDLMTTMAKLKAVINSQNKLLNLLRTKTNHLNLAQGKTKSPIVKEAIDEVLVAEDLFQNQNSLHSAYFGAEKAALSSSLRKKATTSSPDPSSPTHQENILSIHQELRTRPNEAILHEITNRLDSQDAKLALIMAQLETSANHQPSTKNHVQIRDHQANESTFSQVLLKPKTPLSLNEDATWKRPRKKDRKETRVKVRPDVVIVKAGNMPYAEMLRKVKTSEEVKATSSSINAVTKTRDGHLRIVLNRGSTDIRNLTTAIASTIGNDATCTRLSDTSVVEIRDADEETTDEEIVLAIQTLTRTKGSVKVLNKRKVDRGTQIITASVPTSAVTSLTSTRLRIGYVNCRVRRKPEANKCFRCQGFGHTRQDCTNEERSNFCWKCGKDGHKLKECINEAQCLLCKEEATSDHLLGSYKCHAYKRALNATNKK